MNYKVLLFILIVTLIVCGCAYNPTQDYNIEPYGFFSGFWHGMISPFSFICSLFYDNISVYGCNNNGGWYDLGFLIGCGSLIKIGG